MKGHPRLINIFVSPPSSIPTDLAEDYISSSLSKMQSKIQNVYNYIKMENVVWPQAKKNLKFQTAPQGKFWRFDLTNTMFSFMELHV